MEIYLTEVDIAYVILTNIAKSQEGKGFLKIILPQNYSLSIDYSEPGANERKISIDGPNGFHKEWKGGNIVPSAIEECLKQISNQF